MSPRVIYLASKNSHKLAELQALLDKGRFEMRLCTDLDPNISWDETADTFEGNARIKAMAVKALTDCAVLSDDSGLCVDALKGAPGVYSSRYGGVDGDDSRNNKKLIEDLNKVGGDKWPAHFICCLYFVDEKGGETTYSGKCPGVIQASYRGSNGFGYDPLFTPDGHEKTLAQLTEDEKNAISHRKRATTGFLDFLQS